MPKIILTKEQQELYAELKKLSKRANQRIVRLERQFGKDSWGTKYLKEKLESEKVQAWTLKRTCKSKQIDDRNTNDCSYTSD